MNLSGQPCPCRRCKGRLVAYDSHVYGEQRIRYYHCNLCGERPSRNKQSVPLEFFPRRLNQKRLNLKPRDSLRSRRSD